MSASRQGLCATRLARRVEPEGARAWHGIGWSYLRVADGARASRLSALTGSDSQLDPRGVDEAWGLSPTGHRRTVVQGIERVAVPGPAAAEAVEPSVSFEHAVAAIAQSSRSPVLALGGGLDAAAVLVAWRRQLGTAPTVVTLETGIDRYDEVDAAQSICDWLEVPLARVTVNPRELVEQLGSVITCIETPLYGLHPVGRWLLARDLARRGHDVVVTGDGADAVFRGRPDYDYIPIVAALTDAAGLGLRSPFFDDQVLGSWLHRGPDPDKAWVRDYLAQRGAPRWLTSGPKVPRMLPCDASALPLPRHELEGLAGELGRPLSLDTTRRRVQWSTLHMLMDVLRGRG
ncbi:MAG: asparagine synthase-related protein [Myxococcota bacterium]